MCKISSGSDTKTNIGFQDELHVDEQATVTFRFHNFCEYVHEGSRLIFRSGNQTKGSGRVTKVLPLQQQANIATTG